MDNPDAVLVAHIKAVGGDHVFGVVIRDFHKAANLPIRVFRQLDTDLDVYKRQSLWF